MCDLMSFQIFRIWKGFGTARVIAPVRFFVTPCMLPGDDELEESKQWGKWNRSALQLCAVLELFLATIATP